MTPIAPCRTVCRRRRLSRRLRSPARGAGAERGCAGRRVAGRFDGGPGAGYPAPQQNCYESPCAGAPNPAKQRAGVGGAMRPLMNIFWLPLRVRRALRRQRRAGRRMGRRTRGASLASRPAMSCPRLPARAAPSSRRRRLIPTRVAGELGACIDGEDRVSALRPALAGGRLRFEPSVRRWVRPAPGTGASRRDRPIDRTVGRGMCKRRGSPRQPEKHRG